jgi:polysaccharide deacetylase 2 family uncharacterized protein YibQ
MTKRRSSASKGRAPLLLGALAVLALLIFVGGELFAFLTSDLGRVFLYRHTRLGNRAHVVRMIGKRVHEGLRSVGVTPDQTQETVAADAPAMRWHVELPRSGSPMQANAAITREVEKGGGVVLSGREAAVEGGGQSLTLVVGLPGLPTHQVVVVRPGVAKREKGDDEEPAALPEIGLVLFGLGDDVAFDRAVIEREEPFALAIHANGDGHEKLLRDTRAKHREIVLLLPMEPEKYPSQNPGPGAMLVSMSAGKLESMTRAYIKSAGTPVAVANHMGSLATQDEPFVEAVYRALRKDRVSFLHLSPAPRSVCRMLAAREGVAYDEPDRVIDAETKAGRKPALDRAWTEVLERASRRGNALVMMRATSASLEWLDQELAKEGGKRFRLVPVSRVLHRPG